MSDNPLNRAMAAVVAASGRFPDGSSIRSLTYSQRKAVVAAVIESLRTITPEMKVALNGYAQCEGYIEEGWAAAIDVVLEK